MKNKKGFSTIRRLCLTFAFCLCAIPLYSQVFAQSTNQNRPTPITTNEINGEIKARDLGDSRLTSYYYIFTGNRGDVFINVVSNNINGTIDIFALNGLKPRTKITLFADSPDSETGRVVYMRESEKLLLRIQGKSPNDDPGTFQLKFAGSFAPEAALAENDENPKVENATTGEVRVNSVGTIISEPAPKPVIAEKPVTVAEQPVVETSDPPKTESAGSKAAEPIEAEEVKTSPIAAEAEMPEVAETKAADTAEITEPELRIEINADQPKRSALVRITREAVDGEGAEPPTLEQKLAKIELKITFKSGGSFTRPMSEVLSVNVIKGVLTIVTSDGRIQEFSILDVEKMTIE